MDRLEELAAIVALGTAETVVSRFGAIVEQASGIPSLLWAPSGVALAALVLWGRKLWPGVALGAFVAGLLSGISIAAALWFAAMMTIETIAGRVLLHDVLDFRPQLDRVRDVVALVAVAVVLTFTFAALAAAGVVVLGLREPASFVDLWGTWWWGHLTGALIVAPVLLAWGARAPRLREGPRWHLEALALAACLLIVEVMVFAPGIRGALHPASHPYNLFPVLLWAGLRFGPRGAATASFQVALVAIAATALDVGPFRTLADLQTFVSISMWTTLVLSALACERRSATRRGEAIVLTALDAIVSVDAHGRIIEFNPAAEQLFRYRTRDVLGKDLAELVVPPRLRALYRETLSDLAAGNHSEVLGRRIRFPALRAGGGEFVAELSITRVPIDGRVLLLTGFVRDITAEELAEAAQRESRELLEREVAQRTSALARREQLLRQAEALAHLGSFELDARGRTVAWSDELYRIFGRDPATFIPGDDGFFESIHADDHVRVQAAIAHAVKTRGVFAFEHRIVRPDASIRIVQVQGRVVENGSPGAPHVIGCSHDVTERRAADRARQRLVHLVESSNDAIVALSLDGRIETWNAAAAKIFGYRADEVLGQPCTMLVPEAERDGLRAVVERVRAGEHVAHHERTHLRHDGTTFDASLTMSPIVDEMGTVIGLSKVLRDISDQKLVESRLRHSLREKEVLLREIYHRVKNNLQVISSLLALQVAAEPSDGARKALVESQARIQSMALVHQLLYQSRDLGQIDVGDYLRGLASELVKTYDGTARVAVTVVAPAIRLDIDRAIPCGLLVNELVTNALTHGFPDGKRGHVWILLEERGERIVLQVRDDGIGLPAGFSLDAVHSFGLKIARTLAQQLDGTIALTRSEPEGTTARVEFPRGAATNQVTDLVRRTR